MIVWFGVVIAQKLILQVWKMNSVPMYNLWLREMSNTLHLERLRFYNEGRGDEFAFWALILNFFF